MMKDTTLVKCFVCNGDGKETCNNPDHGLYSMFSFHNDFGRIGCPCCGHHPEHKVPNGGDCDECDGSGKLEIEQAMKLAKEYNYDNELELLTPEA